MAGKWRANWSTPLGAGASSSSRPSSPGESGREAELKTFGSIEPEHCHHWLRATGAPLAEVIRHLVKHLNILVGRQRCQVSASTDAAHHRLNVIMIRARRIRRRFAAGASGKPGGDRPRALHPIAAQRRLVPSGSVADRLEERAVPMAEVLHWIGRNCASPCQPLVQERWVSPYSGKLSRS